MTTQKSKIMKTESEILASLKDARDCLYQAERDEAHRWGDIYDTLLGGGEGMTAECAQKMIAEYTLSLLEAEQFRREIATLENI